MWRQIIRFTLIIGLTSLITWNVFLVETAGDAPQQEPTIPSATETTVPETTAPTVPEVTVPETEPPHVHVYISKITPATCINGGYSEYLCECGDQHTDTYTEALGHQWNNWISNKEATWFSAGSEERKCARCAVIETRSTGKRVIHNTGTITVPSSKNLLDYLIEPQPEDFGKYYDNAVKLYNAFLTSQEDWCYLFFAEETYELERQEWRKLKATFEEKCFQNCGVSIYVDSFTTGAFPEGAGLTRINIRVQNTQELYTACCEAIQKMGLYTGMSQYDAVLTMNEWMRQNIVYELKHWSPLDVLQTGKAQCAGYAYLFEYLCKYTGIDATYVEGCVGHDDGPCTYGCHAWNRVKLAGTWYYLDICWNDSNTPNRYFLTEKLWPGRVVMSDSHTA